MELGEQVAVHSERLQRLERDVTELISETRANRHGLRNIQQKQAAQEAVMEADAKRTRTWFMVAGLALTAVNVAVAVLAVLATVPP